MAMGRPKAALILHAGLVRRAFRVSLCRQLLAPLPTPPLQKQLWLPARTQSSVLYTKRSSLDLYISNLSAVCPGGLHGMFT